MPSLIMPGWLGRAPSAVPPDPPRRFDRQIRAFGRPAQRRLADLTVAVVGLGGVGSQVVQSLAHLGVGRLVLIDPDNVSESNLNRLVGATYADAATATSKVTVAARTARSANPDVLVRELAADVLDPATWRALRAADLLIGAVDGHAPRWAMNRAAVQYALCYLDIGVGLGPVPGPDGVPRLEAGGHLAVVRPEGPCLLCMSGYDARKVGPELAPDAVLDAARRDAGYRTDEPDEPTPSVVFVNQILAGHAVGELLNYLSPWRSPQPYLLVDLVAGLTSTIHVDRDLDCPACGPGSPRGLSDTAGAPETARDSVPPPPAIRENPGTNPGPSA
jgi:hypothetical protein